MAFNVSKYILPPGALVQFKSSDYTRDYLDWTFSSLGIKPGDTGLVLHHSKPIYLKILINEQIHDLDLAGFTSIAGCWVHEISIISSPSGIKNQNECALWWPKRL